MSAFNAQFFDGNFPPAILLISTPSSPRAEGDASRWSGFGAKHQIRIRPKIVSGRSSSFRQDHAIEGRYRYIDDILLHEMIHIYLYERGENEDGYSGHGPIFASQCNRIARLLGINTDVTTRRRKGNDREIPVCAQWPTNIRPEGYYFNLLKTKGTVYALDDAQTELDRIVTAWNIAGDEAKIAFREWLSGQAAKGCHV